MPALRESPRVLAAIIATAGAVFGIEGFLIDASAYSSKGNTRLLARKHSRLSLFEECLLRPGVLGGFIGLGMFCIYSNEQELNYSSKHCSDRCHWLYIYLPTTKFTTG